MEQDQADGHAHVPVHAVPGTGRRLATFLAIVVVVLGAAFILRHHRNARAESDLADSAMQAANAPAPVDVVRVRYASSAHLLTLPGEARAWYGSTIYARVSGYVGKWLVDIGDRVKKGQVLAIIDTPELDQQLVAARAKVNASHAEVDVAKSNSDFARKTYERWWESPKGVVSEQEREEKKAEYESGTAKLIAATAHEKLDEADVSRLEAMEAFKNVTAPFDGTITGRHVDIGDLVTAGSTTSTTSLFDIAQSDTIRVFVDVPQSAAAEIQEGMAASASARELPGRTFEGKVARTSRSINMAARTLRVEVDIDNKDLALLPGTYLEVNLQSSQAKPRLQVPAGALNFRSVGPQVAVVKPDGTVKFMDVTIARDLGEYVEIESGLSPDDRVALNISNQIADGDRVSPNEVDEAASPQVSAKKVAAVKAD